MRTGQWRYSFMISSDLTWATIHAPQSEPCSILFFIFLKQSEPCISIFIYVPHTLSFSTLFLRPSPPLYHIILHCTDYWHKFNFSVSLFRWVRVWQYGHGSHRIQTEESWQVNTIDIYASKFILNFWIVSFPSGLFDRKNNTVWYTYYFLLLIYNYLIIYNLY